VSADGFRFRSPAPTKARVSWTGWNTMLGHMNTSFVQ
jgi:hypothetical protein